MIATARVESAPQGEENVIQKTVLIGGPAHLRAVEVPSDAQSITMALDGRQHAYRRLPWFDASTGTVRTFFVHPDLSEGEAAALIMMQVQAV